MTGRYVYGSEFSGERESESVYLKNNFTVIEYRVVNSSNSPGQDRSLKIRNRDSDENETKLISLQVNQQFFILSELSTFPLNIILI